MLRYSFAEAYCNRWDSKNKQNIMIMMIIIIIAIIMKSMDVT